MEDTLKIVFAGTPGSGKSTAISVLSESPPICTDVVNTDPSLKKDRTTVGFDFGQIDLGDGRAVRLVGTPGQSRFEFMWRILAADAFGLVILIDNSRSDPVGDLTAYTEAYKELIPGMNCVVGVGRTVQCPVPTLDQFVDAIASKGYVFPVLGVDVRVRDDVLMLVDLLLAQAEARNTL